MNTKLLNVLQLTTVGMILLFTSEQAISQNLCSTLEWGKWCGEVEGEHGYGKEGVLWTHKECAAIGAYPVSRKGSLTLTDENGTRNISPNDIFQRRECEFGR